MDEELAPRPHSNLDDDDFEDADDGLVGLDVEDVDESSGALVFDRHTSTPAVEGELIESARAFATAARAERQARRLDAHVARCVLR